MNWVGRSCRGGPVWPPFFLCVCRDDEMEHIIEKGQTHRSARTRIRISMRGLGNIHIVGKLDC